MMRLVVLHEPFIAYSQRDVSPAGNGLNGSKWRASLGAWRRRILARRPLPAVTGINLNCQERSGEGLPRAHAFRGELEAPEPQL